MFLEPYFYNPYFNNFFIRGVANTGVFKINGVDRTKYLLAGSYKINESLNNRNNCVLTMTIKPKETTFRPLVGQEITIESRICPTDKYEREFGGVITSIGYTQASCNAVLKIIVNASDYNHILDRRLCYNIFQPSKVKDVILDIVDRFLDDEGIQIGSQFNVPDISLEKFVVPYLSVTKTFDQISKATGLFYYIDYFKRLVFFLRSESRGDFTLTSTCGEAGDINNTDFCAVIKNTTDCEIGRIKFGNIKVKETDSQLGNEYFVVAGQGETTSTKTVEFRGDGKLRTFLLPFKASRVVDIKVDAISVPFSDRDVADVSANWFWSKGENQVSQRDTQPELTSGKTLTVIFYGFYQVTETNNVVSSIERMKEINPNSTGKYQRVYEDENIESSAYALQYCNGLLKRYSDVPVMLEFETDRYRPRVGQLFSAYLPEYGVRKLSSGSDFLIEDVDVDNMEGRFNRYKVKASSMGYQGGWQDFYKKLESFGRRPKLSQESQITFSFNNSEQGCVALSLTVGDITDLKPHCKKTDIYLATGFGRAGAFRVGRPEYRNWQ